MSFGFAAFFSFYLSLTWHSGGLTGVVLACGEQESDPAHLTCHPRFFCFAMAIFICAIVRFSLLLHTSGCVGFSWSKESSRTSPDSQQLPV